MKTFVSKNAKIEPPKSENDKNNNVQNVNLVKVGKTTTKTMCKKWALIKSKKTNAMCKKWTTKKSKTNNVQEVGPPPVRSSEGSRARQPPGTIQFVPPGPVSFLN